MAKAAWVFVVLREKMMNDDVKLEIVKVKPQYIAQVCPRCNGYKTLSYGKVKCSVCGGEGFLKVPVEEVQNGT